jgi:hypothetical protein
MTASLPTPLGPLMTRIIGCGGGASGSELNVVPSAASRPRYSWSCSGTAHDVSMRIRGGHEPRESRRKLASQNLVGAGARRRRRRRGAGCLLPSGGGGGHEAARRGSGERWGGRGGAQRKGTPREEGGAGDCAREPPAEKHRDRTGGRRMWELFAIS